MEKPRRHCRGLVSSVVRRSSPPSGALSSPPQSSSASAPPPWRASCTPPSRCRRSRARPSPTGTHAAVCTGVPCIAAPSPAGTCAGTCRGRPASPWRPPPRPLAVLGDLGLRLRPQQHAEQEDDEDGRDGQPDDCPAGRHGGSGTGQPTARCRLRQRGPSLVAARELRGGRGEIGRASPQPRPREGQHRHQHRRDVGEPAEIPVLPPDLPHFRSEIHCSAFLRRLVGRQVAKETEYTRKPRTALRRMRGSYGSVGT